jgi:filamentous hemagglutinin family protein
MNKHASINRAFRLVWSEARGTWIPVAEIASGRGKRSGRSAARLAPLLVALAGLSAHAAGVVPVPSTSPAPVAAPRAVAIAAALAPTTLPTGGHVVAGVAGIAPGSTPGGANYAVLNIDQGTQRAVIDWSTFNVGAAAQVNFVQPNANSATLNRVLDSNPSQIFGKITATGQVFLTNPNGVYFGKTASVDVGSLAAGAGSIDTADFMAGDITLARNGATGSVVNDGELHAGIGGYIALLAPSVRNSGVVIARLGTVVMAAGDSVTLNFEGNHLAGITVKPASIAALVENRSAVIAPGGLIILSAQALDRLQGGVVRNSGTLEATGMSSKGGRILLEASDGIENSGAIRADAAAESPAGSVTLTAPAIDNSGTISATAGTVTAMPAPGGSRAPGTVAPVSGGTILLNANTVVQTAAGRLDASGANGGSVTLNATRDLSVAGTVSAAATDAASVAAPTGNDSTGTANVQGAAGNGGRIALTAGHNVTLQNALLDVSGSAAGGEILVRGGGQSPSAPPLDPPTLALLGVTELRASSRRGKGGLVTLTADQVGLFDSSAIDVAGATGGGDVLVGGGFHGKDPSIADARQTVVAVSASIDASATQSGDGGRVAVWSDGQTTFAGSIAARGGSTSGAGGFVEVSGARNLEFAGAVNAAAAHGAAGTLLLDPQNIIVATGGGAALTAGTLAFATNTSTDSIIDPGTITALSNVGTAVILQANNDLTISSSIITAGAGTGGSLTFEAGRSIAINAGVTSNNGDIFFTANDPGATGANRAGGSAMFTNNGSIDAGSGTVTITMGTQGASGAISSGKVTAANFTIAQNGPTGGAINGAIDLGQTTVASNLTITSASATNVTNSLGTANTGGSVLVSGTASIGVGTGDVTITGNQTDFNIIGLTAGNVALNDLNAVRFAATNISGSLTETTKGPIASVGAVQVGGLATLTANNGGFGLGDPYIDFATTVNHFGGGLILNVSSVGATGTGGYATLADSGAISMTSATTQTYLTVAAGGTINSTSIGAGTAVSLTSTNGAVTTGATTSGSSIAISATSALGAVTTGTTTAASSVSIAAGGAVTTGATTSTNSSITITSTSGAINLGATNAGTGALRPGGAVSVTGAGTVTTAATTAASLSITGAGAVSLGATNLITNLTANTGGAGAITQTGTLAVTGATALTAGSGFDITLTDPSNTFGFMQIVSARNATLVAASGIEFGSSGSGSLSHIYGALNVTAGGTISQNGNSNGDGYSAIEVDGATAFTANGSAPINLLLGTTDPFSPYVGQANDFVGTITLTANDVNHGFSIVEIRNSSTTAAVITGLTSVGTLADVYLSFDNAPSVSLPAMTVTGSLLLKAPGVLNTAGVPANVISQAGPISAAVVVVQAGATGDIVMTDPGNAITQFAVINSRNATLVDTSGVELYKSGNDQSITGNLTVSAGGDITDGGNIIYVTGTATFDAGSHNVSLTAQNRWNIVAIPHANNVTIDPFASITLGNFLISGTLGIASYSAGSTLSQVLNSTVDMTGNGTTTFNNFTAAITLPSAGNVFGPLAITGGGAVTLQENAVIAQASAWTDTNTIALTTSNDQAITLTQANNDLGPLILTQLNFNPGSAGAVSVTNNGNGAGAFPGLTQGGAWSVDGTTTLNSGGFSIVLNNPANVLGPLQVTALTGTTNSLPSTVTIYAMNTLTADAITDVGSAGAWSTGADIVKLVAYGTTGTIGAGNITLTNAGNLLGALYLKGNNVTITESGGIADGPSLANWDGAGAGAQDSGWATTGATNLIVHNPTGAITISNLTNKIGPISLGTTGTGTLSSVLITDDEDITQNGPWLVGAAPVTLNAQGFLINLPNAGNVMGNINITTANGTTTGVTITENDDITQGSAWILPGVPVTLAAGSNAVTMTTTTNLMGNLTITGGVVSITENGNILQGANPWSTTGITTLNVSALTGFGISLPAAGNVFGPIAIPGTPNAVTITAASNITQASAWVQSGIPFTLNAGIHDILLSQALNQLGDLKLTAANATVTENNPLGITDAGAWTIPGTTTLTAGAANPIVLDANPASNFGTVSIVSASNADIKDVDGIILGVSTISAGGALTVTAGGAITQSGAIAAPSLALIGAGSVTLTNASNNVANLAAARTLGDLSFTDAGDFAVAVVGNTSGINIGAHNVTLTSVSGTVTGLSTVNAGSSALTVATGTPLSLPSLSITGAQTYTAGGAGITLTAGLTSTAAGAINFMSPVTLATNLAVQSTDSPINFTNTVSGGTHQFTVDAGSGLVVFTGAVSAVGTLSNAGAALTLSSGGASFAATLTANNGLAITGPVVFGDTVTLGNGGAASVFTGLVTLGKAGGMNLSGYNGMTFQGGVLLQAGSTVITSNDSPLAFTNSTTVSGPYALTLNSGSAALTGLDHMGADLTSLSVTALNPTVPAGGLSIAGPQTYTATGGSSILLSGDVTSTAVGAISFMSPVLLGASSSVTSSNSAVVFNSTVDGSHDLTIDTGSGVKTFAAAVGSGTSLGDGTGAALILRGTGVATFASVQTRSGITAAGAVTFNNDVTLGNGTAGSVFGGLVTSGGTAGNTISGFDGITFSGGLALVGGPVSVLGNGGVLTFTGAVTGAQNLTLNALALGAGTVVGLDYIGTTSNLTALTVTAQTLSLPSTGLAVAGPMSFTAAGGITLNGAVGSGLATGQIDFNSAVILATAAVTVATHDAAVNFSGTVDGAEALTVNAGSGATTFGAAVGVATPLTSVTTDLGGITAINGGSVRTSAAQTYNDPVTLGADSTLAGINVQFAGTVNGAHALIVNDSGTTTFAGVVGGLTPLTSVITDLPGSVAVNTAAVTTTGAQTYNENMTLGADTSFSGAGLTFGGTVNGAFSLAANASGALHIVGAVGGTTAPTALTASGNTIVAAAVTTSGAQTYTAGGVTLNGNLGTTSSAVSVSGATTVGADLTVASSGGAVTFTGPMTLGGNLNVASSGGAITFAGATSTIDGARALTLTAGTGNVLLGGVVGGVTRLTGITDTGNDLTLPNIFTVNDLNQTYTALGNITLNQSRTLSAPISFTADSDNNGVGSFILLDGVSLTASNQTLSISAADLDLQGSSTLSSGSGLMSINASNGRNIALGGLDGPIVGQMTITGSELSRMSTSAGLSLNTTGAGWVHVDGITTLQSANITGTLALYAHGTGAVSFINNASTFNAITATASGGTINVGVNLSTTNDPIDFATPVSVSGASTISTGTGTTGGNNINFDGALQVDNNLILNTAGGALTFTGAVGSNQKLILNLGGGSVVGLNKLQNTLTGLTVTATSGITLPALTINGPQIYNATTTVTGDLGGVGITFNSAVNVIPTLGSALSLNAGAGTLAINAAAGFNAINMTLSADQITFAGAITGSGSLALQPFTAGRGVIVGGSSVSGSSLSVTAADLGFLPNLSLASVTIGSGTGTGLLDVAGPLTFHTTPLTLNGGGGLTQSGGAIAAGPLTLYSSGSAINLPNAANAFGAVAINGTPSAVTLSNAADITQSAAWILGSAAVTLNAGTHDIALGAAGNTFGTLALSGGNVQVTAAAATDVGASNVTKNLAITSSGGVNFSGALAATGNVTLNAGGVVTQTAPLTIGGNLAVTTSVAAGDVTFNNSGIGSAGTVIGNTQVGGNYVLTAVNSPITQAAGTTLIVTGTVDLTGYSIILGGAGNLTGTDNQHATSALGTTVIDASGPVVLAAGTYSGNLTVTSEATTRSISSGLVSGSAIVLDNSANHISGSISAIASAPGVAQGADGPTGITQTGPITVVGLASFTAQTDVVANSGTITLTTAGNSFGSLLLSGSTVSLGNAATGLTTIGGALASSLTLTTAGGIAQTGPIQSPILAITAAGSVLLNNVANDVNTLNVVSGTNHAITYVDANGFSVAGLDAGGANVSLTAGGSGALTQSAALLNVAALTVNAGGAVTLGNPGNTISSLAASTAGTGLQLYDANAIAVSGAVSTVAGDLSLRAFGDLTLNGAGSLTAVAGNVVASSENAGNFLNNSSAGALALSVGSGARWLVYSDTPDLAGTPHTVKGGLTSAFRIYGATYGSLAPLSVPNLGNGFIYSAARPALTVSATLSGTASQVYGSAPTATLGYSLAGFVDSEDNLGNVITGGAAAYVTSGGALNYTALSSSMNASTYTVKYTGGLTTAANSYTLMASATGPTYTVTPAVLTYTADLASRLYGAADPVFTGTLGGYVNGDSSAVLSGTVTWTTPATTLSPVGQYSINGGGYSLLNGSTNYTFVQAGSNATAFTITTTGLVVSATGSTRPYDGTAFSGGYGVTYSGFANGQSAADLTGTLAYGGSAQGARNAGTYLITPSGLLDGNYAISFSSGNLVIAQAPLTLTTSTIAKPYDGTLAALGTAIATGGTQLFGSDHASGGTFAFTDANAGIGNKTVSVSGVTVSDTNGGGNYIISYAPNTVSTINQAALTIASSNVVKTYDGTLSAGGGATVVSGTLYQNASNGNVFDSLSGGVFAFTDPNAGAGNKTVTTGGVTVLDGNNGANYAITYADNTASTIGKAPLTFVGTIADKTYDSTTAATLSGYTLTGRIGTQTLTASDTSISFADAYAGTGKTVTISGITLADGTLGGLASNYQINSTATALGNIERKVITVSAAVADKVYDSFTTATVTNYGFSGLVGSEVLTATSTANFDTKDVGVAKPVTLSGITLGDGSLGGLARDYVVAPTAAGSATITQAVISQVTGVTAANKVYDGTTAATLVSGTLGFVGEFAGDDLTATATNAVFDTKQAGTNKSVTIGGVVLAGGDAGNYTLIAGGPTNSTANITPRSLLVSATGIDKVYDTSTTAAVILTDNRIAGDSLTATSSNAFATKDVGRGKGVTVTDIAISGTDAIDYSVNTSTGTSANISKASLTVSAIGIDKVYDATTVASVTVIGTPLTGDDLTFSASSAAFSDKNVGTAKTVTASGITDAGADAGNYAFNTVASTTANITPRIISEVTGVTAANKVYDGTTSATLVSGALGFVGEYSGDQLTATATNAVFNDKNAGTNKSVTIGGVVLAGADAGNYTLIAGGPTTSSANITPRPLAVTATGISKVYDTTAAATVTLADNRVAGDSLTLGSTAVFLDKNAGIGKYVAVSNIILGGTDAGNYSANGSASTFADITKAALLVSATGVNKVYDATTAATATLADQPLAGDVVTLNYSTASYADKNVGTAKIVTVSGITGSGASAGNYVLNGAATTVADITPATLTVSATSVPRPNNGSILVDVTLTDNHFAADELSLADSSATFANANVGDGKRVTVTGIEIAGGADRGNYVLASNTVTTSGAITGDATNGAADRAALPPVPPLAAARTPVAVPTAPPAIMDLTMPAHLVIFSKPEISADDAAASNDGVTVSMVQPAPTSNAGSLAGPAPLGARGQLVATVSVFVPEDLASSGAPFSFALPDELFAVAPEAEVIVTRMNRKNLPSWLRFVQYNRSFKAKAIPKGALPIDVLVTVGQQRFKVKITDRPNAQ